MGLEVQGPARWNALRKWAHGNVSGDLLLLIQTAGGKTCKKYFSLLFPLVVC